jgi:hypothetical protein
MANNDVQKFSPGLLPTASPKARGTLQQSDAFRAGLPTPFAQLSIQGKMFALKVGKNVAPFLDATTRRPIPVDVVLVDASPAMAKRFFMRGYQEGDTDLPDCFSNDAIRASPRSPHMQNNGSCRGCPHNEPRSAKNPDGSAREGKACQDKKLLAVVFANDLIAGAIGPVQLQVPYMSQANLGAYIDFLRGQGYGPNAVITTLDFDWRHDLSYPKLTFNPRRALTEEEIDSATDWVDDERTKRIVATDDRASPAAPDLEPSETGGRGPILYGAGLATPQAQAAPQAASRPAPVVDTRPEPEPVSEQPEATQAEDDAPLPGLVPLNVPGMSGAFLNPQTHQVVKADGSPYNVGEKVEPPSFQGSTPAAQPAAEPAKPAKRGRRSTAAGAPEASLQQSDTPAPNGKPAKDLDAPLPEAGESLSDMVARLSKMMPPPQG